MGMTLFENCNLFNGNDPDIADGMHILVEDTRIREVSDQPIAVTGEAVRLDCRGKTVMPGMIDAHVHVYVASADLNSMRWPGTYNAHYAARFLGHILDCGFTTVRDVAGGDHGLALALRDGLVHGPRFFYGGLSLSQTGGHGDMRAPEDILGACCGAEINSLAIVVDGVDGCIKAAREQLRRGANHIKIMGSGGVMSPADPLERCQYSESEIRAIVEECTRHGAYVAAHCHPAEAIRRCVEFGVRSIEHGTLIDAETAALVAAHNAFVVPTMAIIFALKDDLPNLSTNPVYLDKLHNIASQALSGLEIMQAAGVQMGFGTDLLGAQHVRQGSEFMLRAEVLTPFDILHSATAVNAALIQRGGELGCIAAGALADILVVDGNPLDDIMLLAANGAHLSVIMKDGQMHRNRLS